MEERQATPTLQEFPQLQRLAMFSPANHGLIADYLAHLRARHYAPSVQEGTIRALKSFASLLPEARQGLDHRIGHLASIRTQKIERLNSSRG
jgi:hypothetical protein